MQPTSKRGTGTDTPDFSLIQSLGTEEWDNKKHIKFTGE